MPVESTQDLVLTPMAPMHCMRFAKSSPPRQVLLPNGTPIWLVSRHADVRQALTDRRLTRSLLCAPDAPRTLDVPNILQNPNDVGNLDGAAHRRIRQMMNFAFTPRAIEQWRPWVAAIVESLLDDLENSRPPVDIVMALTEPLPLAITGRLMGLEDVDQARIRQWSDYAISTTAYPADDVRQAMTEFYAFAMALVADRESNPGDDLISKLVRAAEDVPEITEEQVASLVVGLVVAGQAATTVALSNALVYLLIDRRESWRRLGEADEVAARGAVDQLLRAIPLSDMTSIPGMLRRAAEPVDIGGVTIQAGDVVAAHQGIANHDPDVYPDPDALDIFAPLTTPHLTFGAGQHHCPGSWLARMGAELVLHRLAQRFPTMRSGVALDALRWSEGLNLRSPVALPVEW